MLRGIDVKPFEDRSVRIKCDDDEGGMMRKGMRKGVKGVEINVVVKYTTWYLCNSVGLHAHINNTMMVNVIVNIKRGRIKTVEIPQI